MDEKKWQVVVDLIKLGAVLLPPALDAYREACKRIAKMVEEGRDPTPEEHAELNKVLNELHESIQKPIEGDSEDNIGGDFHD